MRHLPLDIGEQIARPPLKGRGVAIVIRRLLGIMPPDAGKRRNGLQLDRDPR